ncbi:MAG: hypothetical protein NT169_26780 [Chloroflexi bacterium]|nr:hypothetical protein [Chloroflexota bacterium]
MKSSPLDAAAGVSHPAGPAWTAGAAAGANSASSKRIVAMRMCFIVSLLERLSEIVFLTMTASRYRRITSGRKSAWVYGRPTSAPAATPKAGNDLRGVAGLAGGRPLADDAMEHHASGRPAAAAPADHLPGRRVSKTSQVASAVSSQFVGAHPCGRPRGQAQGRAPTPDY